jgi:hypothetical protein
MNKGILYTFLFCVFAVLAFCHSVKREDIKVQNVPAILTRDNYYAEIPGGWFRNKCLYNVAEYFKAKRIAYMIEVMDCDDIADIFIAAVKAEYINQYKDKDGNFVGTTSNLMIGHIILEDRKDSTKHHDAVIYKTDDSDWVVVEPLDILENVRNKTPISFAQSSIAQVMERWIILRAEF